MSARGLLRLAHLTFLTFVGGVCLLAPARARAQYASLSGWCQTGKVQTLTSGIPSTLPPLGAYVQGSYPGCTVTLYYTGTTNLVPGADIFSDALGTVLGNPFTASNSTGQWTFFINQSLSATSGANGIFDIKLSGGNLPAPVTIPYASPSINPAISNLGQITSLAPSITPTSIEQVRYADQSCTTPNVLDQTCINNAIWALPAAGGRVLLGANNTYLLASPVVMHRGVILEGASRRTTVIQGNGIADFSTSGMIRWCDNETCSDTPVTSGEQDSGIEHVDIRIKRAADIGINAFGFSESFMNDVIVEVQRGDSACSSTPGSCWGTGLSLNGGVGTSDYSNLFSHFYTDNLNNGVVLGVATVSASAANNETMVGGVISAHNPLDINSGFGNSFSGTRFVGTNQNGEVLINVNGGALTGQNAGFGLYLEDGLTGGNTATGISISAGVVGDSWDIAVVDGHGGSLSPLANSGTSTTFFDRSGGNSVLNTPGTLTLGGTAQFANPIGGTVNFANDVPPFTIGSATTHPIQIFRNSASGNPPNSFELDMDLFNSAQAQKTATYINSSLTNITAGNETTRTQIGAYQNGALGNLLDCTGNACNFPGSLAEAGTAVALASQLPLSGSVAGSTTLLAANSCGDTVTVTITGATTSMVVEANSSAAFPATSNGLFTRAAVTSANTVTIGYCNVTSSGITPAAATVYVRVVQ